MSSMKKGYSSELQRKRSANSPWRTGSMVNTNKAYSTKKKLKESPNTRTPRTDLD
jgi:hypothetical protein